MKRKNLLFQLNSICKEIDSINETEFIPFNKAIQSRMDNLLAIKRDLEAQLRTKVQGMN